jgi:hypothetical protein
VWSRRPGAGVKFFGKQASRRATVTNKPKETVKTIARGKPGVPVNLWSTTVCFLPFAHGAMGAAGTRLFLHPFWGKRLCIIRAPRVAKTRSRIFFPRTLTQRSAWRSLQELSIFPKSKQKGRSIRSAL